MPLPPSAPRRKHPLSQNICRAVYGAARCHQYHRLSRCRIHRCPSDAICRDLLPDTDHHPLTRPSNAFFVDAALMFAASVACAFASRAHYAGRHERRVMAVLACVEFVVALGLIAVAAQLRELADCG